MGERGKKKETEKQDKDFAFRSSLSRVLKHGLNFCINHFKRLYWPKMKPGFKRQLLSVESVGLSLLNIHARMKFLLFVLIVVTTAVLVKN